MSSPDQSTGRVAVITGASSGIGEATARALAAAGFWLALLARRAARIQADELPSHITHEETREAVTGAYERLALTAEDIGEIIAFAVTRSRRVSINEVLVRPTGQA